MKALAALCLTALSSFCAAESQRETLDNLARSQVVVLDLWCRQEGLTHVDWRECGSLLSANDPGTYHSWCDQAVWLLEGERSKDMLRLRRIADEFCLGHNDYFNWRWPA